MELVIVFDNYSLIPAGQAGWGYACYFPEKRFLFDTGSEPLTLKHNFSCLGLNAEDVKTIMLSHFHWDHTGGLFALLNSDQEPKRVILHQGFSPRFAQEIERLGAEVEFINEAREVIPGFFTTGPLPGPTLEAGLVVRTEKGLALITGCAHPGVLFMSEKVKELFGKAPFLVMGGFHLASASQKEVLRLAEGLLSLGVKQIAPSHCTGDKARRIFADLFGEGYLHAGVGFRINL